MFNKQLYNLPYHEVDLSKYSFLITGGAGFIGSNLVEYLLKYNAGHVRVLDNLSNGYFENIKDFKGFKNFEFIEGDIRDFGVCKQAVEGINYISHQAALGSVPRSIADPITSNNVNISGFVNMLTAAKESNTLKSFVYAASSSTYGDSPSLPKIEGNEGKPLSPYAVTKLVNELYADIFSKTYGLHSTGLRYFNVFGPKQSPTNAYAAVIPKFITSALRQTSPTIFGDGETSRDFTFIENVVQANIKALLNFTEIQNHEVLNIAFVNELSMIFNKLNIDTTEVLEAASTKWNFINFRPGLVGGHCIGVDPYYLAQKAQEVGHNPEIILGGRRINDNMANFIVTDLIKELILNKVKIYDSKILILGITFKENCPDIRNSKVIDIHNELIKYGIEVDVFDNWASEEDVKKYYSIKLIKDKKKIINKNYSAIIIAVAHDEFKSINLFRNNNCFVYDLKSVLDKKDSNKRL